MTGFDAFWAEWPRNVIGGYCRKGAKSECKKRWIARKLDAEAHDIVKHVRWMKTTPAWQKEKGLYIVAPLVYINGRPWDGAEIPEASTDAQTYAQREAELMAASIAQARVARPAPVKQALPGYVQELVAKMRARA